METANLCKIDLIEFGIIKEKNEKDLIINDWGPNINMIDIDKSLIIEFVRPIIIKGRINVSRFYISTSLSGDFVKYNKDKEFIKFYLNFIKFFKKNFLIKIRPWESERSKYLQADYATVKAFEAIKNKEFLLDYEGLAKF
jgi:hypothetical protein